MHSVVPLSMLALALSACVAPADETDAGDACFPGEKCDSLDQTGGVAATSDRGVDVLSGFNLITARATSSCVKPVSGSSYVAGQSSETVDLVYLEHRNSLDVETSTALGLDLDLGVFGISAVHELLHHASTKSTSINLLVRMSADYWVMHRGPLALERSAATKLRTGIGPFATACGTHYATGVRYGGYVYALVTLDATDRSSIDSVKTELGLSLFGIIPLTPSIRDKVTTVASSSDVAVTMKFAADGFMLDGRPASAPLLSTLFGEGIGPAFFATLDHVREQLEASINEDKCRDGGLGSCAGSPSPGFANNTLRNARPTAVLAGKYDRLPRGVPATLDARWAEIRARTERTEQHLRALHDLDARVDKVYREEVLVAQRHPRPELLQVLPPAEPVVLGSDLAPIIAKWSDRLGPDGPGRKPVRDAAQACFEASADLSTCASDEPFDRSATKRAIDAELDEYARTGRVAIVDWDSGGGGGRSRSDALSACRPGSRFATDDEARYLAPLISWRNIFPVPTVWTAGYRCGNDGYPAMEVNAALRYVRPVCGHEGYWNTDRFAVLCVPTRGPVPELPAP